MKSFRINAKDPETAQKLDMILSLFGDDIEKIPLREGNEEQNKGDEYENCIAKILNFMECQVIKTGKIFLTEDSKTDLIAIKKNTLILIQCKNYKENTLAIFRIGKKELIDIKQGMDEFLKKHIWINKNIDVKFYIFVSYENIIKPDAQKYCKESKNIKYITIKCEKKSCTIDPNLEEYFDF